MPLPQVRRFSSADLPILDGWHRARGAGAIAPELLPETGFIVDGVGAGFVYFTDSVIALLDGFVTNPDAPADARHAALDAVTCALLDEAREHGARCVLAYSNDGGIQTRAVRHGFERKAAHVLYAKEI